MSSGGSNRRETTTTQEQTAIDNRQDNSINNSQIIGRDQVTIEDVEYTVDNSDRSVHAVDNSDNRQIDNSDRSVYAADNSDNRQIDNSDRSVRATDNSDRSVRATDNSVNTTTIDSRQITNITDGGAIKSNEAVSLAALDLSAANSQLAYTFAADAQDGSYEAISRILSDSAVADARGDAAAAGIFATAIQNTQSEGSRAVRQIIMAGAALGALAFLTR